MQRRCDGGPIPGWRRRGGCGGSIAPTSIPTADVWYLAAEPGSPCPWPWVSSQWKLRVGWMWRRLALAGRGRALRRGVHNVISRASGDGHRRLLRCPCGPAALPRVDVLWDQHTTHFEHAARGGARCSASCVDRSDRFKGAVRPVAAEQIDDEPTNVSPGKPIRAGARRVILGSAGHLERPQST